MKTSHAGGKIPGLARAPRDIYVETLSKYTKAQLYELRDRQEKLLVNKCRLSKLPDKGARIQKFYQQILNEISSQNEIDEAAEMFSDLNIASKGIKAMINMEWTGGKETGPPPEVALDSDDDEEYKDPIKLLAQSRGNVKLVKVEPPEENLITPADLKEVQSFSKIHTELSKLDIESRAKAESDQNVSEEGTERSCTSSVALEPHAIYVCDKDMAFRDTSGIRTKFKPYKTTISGSHDIAKEKARKTGKHWEVTAATPPVLRNSGTSILTMQESIDIQKNQYDLMKDMQEKQAKERLETRRKLIADNLDLLPPGSSTKDPKEFFETYRHKTETPDSDSDEEFASENEDDGEEPERGGVKICY